MSDIIKRGQINTINVSADGANVQLAYNGKLVADLEWKAALALAKALYIKAKQAEEWAKADQVMGDQALMLRTNAPFGLTNNPAILKEAAKEAQWGDMRRYVPMKGVPSREAFGTPAIINHGVKRNGK
jgi:hypothetical protein